LIHALRTSHHLSRRGFKPQVTRTARKSDGRRIFTPKFRCEQISRVLNGELTVAELSRKLAIAPGLLHRWKRLETLGNRNATVKANNAAATVISQSAEQQIHELHRLVCKQMAEIDNLSAEIAELKLRRRA
jgi:transposase-like protein